MQKNAYNITHKRKVIRIIIDIERQRSGIFPSDKNFLTDFAVSNGAPSCIKIILDVEGIKSQKLL